MYKERSQEVHFDNPRLGIIFVIRAPEPPKELPKLMEPIYLKSVRFDFLIRAATDLSNL
jgi:hypothetical protein